MIRDKQILITGGAGFIGTHIAERLVEENEVTVLDIDLENALAYSPLANDERVRKVLGDVRDPKLVSEEVASSQIVLHYASLIGVKSVIENAIDTIQTIILGTRNVLEAASKNKSIERLVYISTSEVYGNIINAEEGAPASIGTDNDGRLCYASAKLMGEHQVWAYHRDFDLPTVVVRPFNIFGPRRLASHAVGLFRKIRYWFKHCRVYFYDLMTIESLVNGLGEYRLVKIPGQGMDYFVSVDVR